MDLIINRRGAKELSALMDELCSASESACRDLTNHMQREELQASTYTRSLVLSKGSCMRPDWT